MIIFICGAVNAGKSTVGKMLAERLGAAFIEGDDVRKIFYWQKVEEARPAIVDTIGAIVRTLAERGLSVVVAYPLWQEDFEPLQKHLLGLSSDIHYIALNPPIEVATQNRGSRALEGWEVDFIKQLYERGVNNPPFAISLDNSVTTPAQTMEKILALLK